jgi:N-acetylglutamate synthase-like GNAT family acetyltransferase
MPSNAFSFEALAHRFFQPEPHAAGPKVETGTAADYAALAEHHYRAHRPATFTRVLVIRSPQPDAAGRFLPRAAARPPRPPRTLAVLVESLPALRCALRDHALAGRYRDLKGRDLAHTLNRELRCISRVVVHPQWRSVGLAGRLVRHALATASTPYTEALAAMGRAHPFFARAGMVAYDRPPHPHDARLLDALTYARLSPLALADPERLLQVLQPDSDPGHALLLRELRRWHRTRTRAAASEAQPDPCQLIRLASERLLSQPLYYLAHRPLLQQSPSPEYLT